MLKFDREAGAYFTDTPEFALVWGGVLAFIAVAACYVWEVQSAFVRGGGKWHHAMRGPDLEQMGDTGIRLELGPHAWWKRLGPHDVELVLRHWRTREFVQVEGLIQSPDVLLAMPAGRVQ